MPEIKEMQPREMLVRILDGATLIEVARTADLPRGQVARHVKHLARTLQTVVGVVGVDEWASPSMALLQRFRANYLEALEHYDPSRVRCARATRPLASRDDVLRLVASIGFRSAQKDRDTAMALLLFNSGARPDELAALTIADFLQPDGSVRENALVAPPSGASKRTRPIRFLHHGTVRAIEQYLATRQRPEADARACPQPYRGLAPDAPLFADAAGRSLTAGRQRGDSNVHRIFTKIFRQADMVDIGTLGARRAHAHHLRRHGLDDRQIAEELGLADAAAVRQLLSCLALPVEQALRVFP